MGRPRHALAAAVLSAAALAATSTPGHTQHGARSGVEEVAAAAGGNVVPSIGRFDTDGAQTTDTGLSSAAATAMLPLTSLPPRSPFAALPEPVDYLEHIVKSMW